MVNLAQLKTELQTDPTLLGYAPFLSNSPGKVVQLLNQQNSTNTKLVTRSIGIGTVLNVLGPSEGASVLNALETLKASNAVIKWAWYLLEKTDLDVGLQSTRTQLDGLVSAGVLTQQQCDTIKNLAVTTSSRAEALFGNNTNVTEADVRAALLA
jgi:hypothetical protein